MGSRKTHDGADAVYAAAQKWVDCALRKDDSLFTPGKPIWSSRWLKELRERFLDQPDVGRGGFYDKLRQQLEGSPPEVYQLMGETLYVHFLIIWPRTMKGDTKASRINGVLGWSEEGVEIPPELVAPLAPGIANIGQGWAGWFPYYVGFVIECAERWKELGSDEHGRLLAEPWEFKRFATAGVDLRGQLNQKFPNAHRVQLEALLHLVHPGTFEGTVAVEQKEEIAGADAFAHFVSEPTDDVDRKVQQIRLGLEAELRRDFDFYDPDVRSRWDPNFDSWDELIKQAKRTGRLWSNRRRMALQVIGDWQSARGCARGDDQR